MKLLCVTHKLWISFSTKIIAKQIATRWTSMISQVLGCLKDVFLKSLIPTFGPLQ